VVVDVFEIKTSQLARSLIFDHSDGSASVDEKDVAHGLNFKSL